MKGKRATRMDALEIDDFLETRSTGVLSLASDDDSYAIPVSFARLDSDIYLRLGYGPDSHKREFVETTDRATFVVYGEVEGGWKSVVARGRLETLAENSVDSSIVEVTRSLDIPYFRVFGDDSENLEFNIVRIDVERLTGIVSGGVDD